ncbi:lipopolysaccharide biosynthesis protein [Photobacterium leiognathi]|uniref:lipopolysaccharide biosynthesis protein n=1 Tax=Photobacterium leiognathi TaxID=553611 RepID=UPI0029816EFA|nr:lipopolysaccharide biosynthesis protein [Photobacterium leiognathi]
MIEQKFQQFKTSITPEEFNNIEFLTSKAEQMKENDEALAKRILVRVNNLNKQNANNQKAKIKPNNPESNPLHLVSSDDAEKSDKNTSSRLAAIYSRLTSSPFLVLVIIPTLIFAFYQNFWATERYESQAQVIVQQPDGMATMDTGLALLSGMGMGMPTSGKDTELVKAYIYSNDMLNYLNKTLDLKAHYSQSTVDYFSRIHNSDSREELLEFYKKHINVYIDDKSGVVNIFSQAFNPDFSLMLTQTIVDRAEWYINSIGHQLAEAQLNFIKGEHQIVENKLEVAQKNLLNFQQRYNLLDPMAEGAAMQQITYTLEGQISAKQAELKGLQSIMSAKAPQVISLQNTITALKSQLINERNKLSTDSAQNIPVSEILASYTDLKIKMELALQAYTSSQVSLEKSRIEAYRQLKYLVVVESATHPEQNKYPDVFYNVSLFALIISMLFSIVKIIILTIKELR